MLHDSNDASLFPRLPEEEVRKLARYGSEVRLEAGETLFPEDEPPGDFFVVLEGEVELTKRIGGEETVLAVHGRGEFTGDVSLITGKRVTAAARSVGASRVCRIPGGDFARVMVENPLVAQTVFRAVAGRTEELGAQLQQTAKLASLGAMSAGLAHELNNPAAAARSAAEQLDATLRELRVRALKLGEHGLSAEELRFLAALERGAGETESTDKLDPLAMSDLEDELADWLDSHGADGLELAPTFAGAGLDDRWLETVAENVGAGALGDALAWLASTFEAEGLAQEVRQTTARLSGLVGAMKEYTHMDRAPSQEVDVREGLESTLTILGHKLKGGVEVERDYESDLPLIWAHGGELNQVWTNLMDNAVDAMGGEGRLRIGARREGHRVLVEISDDGPGIPEEVRDRIFEPFFTTKGVGQGTGLGLDIVRRIVVNRHGGEIRVESEPGDTRFEVRLPIAASAPSG